MTEVIKENNSEITSNINVTNGIEKVVAVEEGIDNFNIVLDHYDKVNSFSESNSEFSLQEFYKFTLKFYRDKGGKAVQFSYKDRCHLVALTQQVNHGPYNETTSPSLGVLDVVGKDRRLAWQSLGTISKEDAMIQFIDKIDELTPTFKPYIEALKADHLEKERLIKEEKQREEAVEITKQIEELEKEQEERRGQEETKRQIQEALNEQTFAQFKNYAVQQFPNNPEEQGALIKQLQEQHYQQYMQQVYQQQLLFQQQQNQLKNAPVDTDSEAVNLNSLSNLSLEEEENITKSDDPLLEGSTTTEEDLQTDFEDDKNIVPASMWTRRDIKDFKDSIRQEGKDSIIKVGHGETVTVRVPTHEDGTCLFWEFATDSYDIGFGVYFEWTHDPSNVVSVHITESDDEDEEEEDDEDGESDDIERLGGTKSIANKPPLSVIIPVYRRDSHEEVYAGSHAYPGTGVYLLKFDNCYSLWRNKVLYYRVYYTR